MKNVILATILVAGILISQFVGLASAAGPLPVDKPDTNPYQGTYQGYIYGYKDSRAPVSLQLNQHGHQVQGTLTLGEGLYIDAGLCGKGSLPALTQSGILQTLPDNPNRILLQTTYRLSGFEIGVHLDSTVTDDGHLNATGKIDLPWLCGIDPQLNASLIRVD